MNKNFKITVGGLFTTYCELVTPLTFILSLIMCFGYGYYRFDNLSHLKYHIFLCGLGLLFFATILTVKNRKHLWLVFLSIFIVIINFVDIAPYMIPFNKNIELKNGGIKILMSNVLKSNNNYKSVLNMVKRENPDILILQETDRKWKANIGELKTAYKYGIEDIRDDCFGIAVYSKEPVENAKVIYFTYKDITLPYITFQADIEDKKVNFITLHPLPPGRADSFEFRNKQLEFTTNWVKQSKYPVVLIGDLNISPFSYYYKQMVSKAGLVNSREGFGLYQSWPTSVPQEWGLIIDHIMHTRELQTVSFKTCEDIGSDHLPIVARIRYSKK